MLQNELDMTFNYEPITYGKIKSGEERISNGKINSVIKQMLPGEKFCDTMKRIYGKSSGFSRVVISCSDIFPTQTAGHADVWLTNGNRPSFSDVIHAQTFPEDYDFSGQPIEIHLWNVGPSHNDKENCNKTYRKWCIRVNIGLIDVDGHNFPKTECTERDSRFTTMVQQQAYIPILQRF